MHADSEEDALNAVKRAQRNGQSMISKEIAHPHLEIPPNTKPVVYACAWVEENVAKILTFVYFKRDDQDWVQALTGAQNHFISVVAPQYGYRNITDCTIADFRNVGQYNVHGRDHLYKVLTRRIG